MGGSVGRLHARCGNERIPWGIGGIEVRVENAAAGLGVLVGMQMLGI